MVHMRDGSAESTVRTGRESSSLRPTHAHACDVDVPWHEIPVRGAVVSARPRTSPRIAPWDALLRSPPLPAAHGCGSHRLQVQSKSRGPERRAPVYQPA
jgi:hypothetical protein